MKIFSVNTWRVIFSKRVDKFVWGGAKRMKVRAQSFLLIGVVFLSLILMTGCGTLETLVKKDGTSTPLAEWIGGSGDQQASLPATTRPGEGIAVALYFPDMSGKYLLKEERMLPKTVSMARETVNQWLKGPVGTGTMQSSVSTITTLRDIAIRNNVVIVDLSKEFLQSNSNVSPEVALYGLVNTLTQFSTIKQVQLRVEGKSITKYGNVDATNLVYKANLVKGTLTGNQTVPKTGTGNAGLGIVVPSSNSNGALPDSPSSINLFNYPPSTT